MTTEIYRIFLSSGMQEFQKERSLIKDELNALFSTFVYEEDAGARTETIQETYINELKKCHLYIGLFGLRYGPDTIKEFECAQENNINCLIYERELLKGEIRDQKLTDFLGKIGGTKEGALLAPCRFHSVSDLLIKLKRDLGRWAKSRDASEELTAETFKLDNYKRYYCDRVTQAMDFSMEDKEERFNFFIIDGAKTQSHVGLVKRFSIDKTKGDHSKSVITIDDYGNLKRLQRYIQIELFKKFGEDQLPDDLSIGNLAERINKQGYKQVFILFGIQEDLLANKNIKEVIDWFTNSYCKEENLLSESPIFYFFLIIRYNESGMSKKKSIKRKLQQFKEYIKLEELENVKFEDVRQWVEVHNISDKVMTQEKIVRSYFDGDTFPMETVEMRLAKLISDYNNDNQQLIDLMNNSQLNG